MGLPAARVGDEVADSNAMFPDKPTRNGSWMDTNARFKGESGQMTTPLGQGDAIDIFNENLVDFERIK